MSRNNNDDDGIVFLHYCRGCDSKWISNDRNYRCTACGIYDIDENLHAIKVTKVKLVNGPGEQTYIPIKSIKILEAR